MIRATLDKYYRREDRAFLCGLFQTIGVALMAFVAFKAVDYFVTAPTHSHAHFGLLCSYGWLSWIVQAFAFIGAGLTWFFATKWRQARKSIIKVDPDKVTNLTRALQCRERKLQESERRYRSLFNHTIAGTAIHTIVCRLNPETGQEEPCDYTFIDVNPAFLQLFGFAREQIIGRTVLDIMPNTEPCIIERFAKVADTGVPDRFRCRFNDINKWFEVTAFSNQPTQFAASFLDVTDRADRTGKRERITDRRTL